MESEISLFFIFLNAVRNLTIILYFLRWCDWLEGGKTVDGIYQRDLHLMAMQEKLRLAEEKLQRQEVLSQVQQQKLEH
jgi:hypothetical protein